MARASQTMIAALGATGWIGFDFLPDADGKRVLIECNPRPIPVCHLGGSVGVDLAGALAALLAGGEVPPVPLDATATREWQLLLRPAGA
jgi:predicted ATP-grasp superfamily ATP-dependent carboligase